MKVVWESEDLVEAILSLKPALCDVVSKSGEHLVLPILDSDITNHEALKCQLTNFLLRNSICSVLVASFMDPEGSRIIDLFKGFWVSASESGDTITLHYQEIPSSLIKMEMEKYIDPLAQPPL